MAVAFIGPPAGRSGWSAQEPRGGAHGVMLGAVHRGAVAEPPTSGPVCHRCLVRVVDVDSGGREHPAVVGATGPGPVLVDGARVRRRASGSAPARRSRAAGDRPAARAPGTAAAAGCARGCRPRRVRCARTATTGSTRCNHRTARPTRSSPRTALWISPSQVEKSPAGRLLATAGSTPRRGAPGLGSDLAVPDEPSYDRRVRRCRCRRRPRWRRPVGTGPGGSPSRCSCRP